MHIREGQLSIGADFDGVLAAAREGAPWAFERLYADLAPVVAGYARLQGSLEPDDVASEVFLGVFAGLSSFAGSEQQFRVLGLHHRVPAGDRRSAAVPASGDDGRRPGDLKQVLGGDAEHDALAELGRRRVHELCAGLSDDQREVVLLRVLGDLSVEEAAAIVGKTAGAVKALQRLGLNALRRQLDREGVST
ncbi:RNA polymerase sigma factor [Jiangella alkaliphila]|uniref:RNA polymerase sigma-70 factor, ECF subfamily n=1 Tax=Jiangella alkaliphila TaxID=419479 RepID=A0A1H2IUZ6_9ACTN|nr:RNA polymerase sigma factor [Jiangella alkaliphila]SDU47765.1 RNA polymerase sigma-70 factor, ECF subfamily [Jiangella alkaliphila]